MSSSSNSVDQSKRPREDSEDSPKAKQPRNDNFFEQFMDGGGNWYEVSSRDRTCGQVSVSRFKSGAGNMWKTLTFLRIKLNLKMRAEPSRAPRFSSSSSSATGKQHCYSEKSAKDYHERLQKAIREALPSWFRRFPRPEEVLIPRECLIDVIKIAFAFPFTNKHKSSEFYRNLVKLEQRPVHYLYKTSRPDLDNLLKPLLDGMRGLIYHDDARIVGFQSIIKHWDYGAHIEIVIDWFKNPEFWFEKRPKGSQATIGEDTEESGSKEKLSDQAKVDVCRAGMGNRNDY